MRKPCCKIASPPARDASRSGGRILSGKILSRLIRFTPLTMALLLGCKVGAQSTLSPALPENVPAFRLSRPHWSSLTAAHIKALFSDSSLLIDEDYAPFPGMKVDIVYLGGCAPTETFYRDGRWRLGECQVIPRTYEGNWTIEDNGSSASLCVAASDRPKECRVVWQGASTSSVIMTIKPDVRSTALNTRYNPYRIVKRVMP